MSLRDELIEAAIAEIAESGVEKLSVRELTRKLNVSHSAPKSHFSTKMDLLSAIVIQCYQELIQYTFEAGAPPDAGARDRLERLIRRYVEWGLANPHKFQVMTNPDVSRYADEDLKKLLQFFAEQLEQIIASNQQSGWLAERSPKFAAHYLLGTVFGMTSIFVDGLMSSALKLDEDIQLDSIVEQILA